MRLPPPPRRCLAKPRLILQSQQHHHRVVRVGVEDVVELERPSARLHAWILHAPVPAHAHLFAREPSGGAADFVALRIDAARGERDQIDGGVPDRREAGLDAEILRVIDEEAREVPLGLDEERVIFRIAQRLEGDERVQHRGENRSEAVAALAHALGHPPLRAFQREAAPHFPREALEVLEHPVAGEEEVRPAQARAGPSAAQVGVLGADGVELVELLPGGERARGFVVIEDREREEHRAAPRGEFVDVEEEPAREEHHLDRDGGQELPRELAEQREVELRVGVHARDAAEPQDARAAFVHPWLHGRVAGELQREVGFHAGIHVAGPALVDVPPAVGELPAADVRHAFLLQDRIHLPSPVHVEHVVRAERAIDEELAAPMSVRVLEAEEIRLRAGDGKLEGIGGLPKLGQHGENE